MLQKFAERQQSKSTPEPLESLSQVPSVLSAPEASAAPIEEEVAAAGEISSVALDVSKPAIASNAPLYSHDLMIDLIIANPHFTHKQLAGHFGRKTGWFASIIASTGFQAALELRKGEIVDPSLTASMPERLAALAVRALDVLQDKLDSKEVSEFIVVKAAELGVKGLGLGNATTTINVNPQAGNIESIADRLVSALQKQRENVRRPETVVQDVPFTSAQGAPRGQHQQQQLQVPNKESSATRKLTPRPTAQAQREVEVIIEAAREEVNSDVEEYATVMFTAGNR